MAWGDAQADYRNRSFEMLRDQNTVQARRKDANNSAALVALIEQGLRMAWHASPQTFPVTFDPHATALVAANYVLTGR